MDRITFRCKTFQDATVLRVWYLLLNGKPIYGCFVYEVHGLNSEDEIYYRAYYDDRNIPHRKRIHTSLSAAKRDLVEYFNLTYDRPKAPPD